AVAAVVEAGEGGLDLGDQLALAGAGGPLDRAVGFRGGTGGGSGGIFVLRPGMSGRVLCPPPGLLFSLQQVLAGITPLALVHEWLFVSRTVRLVLVQDLDAILLRHCFPVHQLRGLARSRASPPCSRARLYRPARSWTISELWPEPGLVRCERKIGRGAAPRPIGRPRKPRAASGAPSWQSRPRPAARSHQARHRAGRRPSSP